MLGFVIRVGLIHLLIVQGLQAQFRDGCLVEPPPVPNSYRLYSGTDVVYYCRGNELVKYVKVCADTYTLDDFRFCTYNCNYIFPLETGATRANVSKSDVGGGVSKLYADYYECVKGFIAPSERLKPPFNQPICDMTTQLYRRSELGCYLQDVNFVSGCRPIPGYVEAASPINKLYAHPSVDGNVDTFSEIVPNGKGPMWECKINSANITEVTDIDITAKCGAVSFTIVDENKHEYLCGNFVSSNNATVRNVIKCSMVNDSIPAGVSVRMYSDTSVTLYEIAVRGRSYIRWCSSPPTFHGMVLELTSSTQAIYKCAPNFHALRGNGFVVCNTHRIWTFPTLRCTDKINIAGKYVVVSHSNLYTIIDGNDSTCYKFTSCYKSSRQTIFINYTLEIETVVLIHKDTLFSQINVSVSVGNKNCEAAEIIDINTITFSCLSRPASDHITIYFTIPETVTATLKFDQMCTLCEIKLFGRELVSTDSSLECYQHSLGKDYKGKLNTTASGKSCQSWRGLYPHKHNYNREEFFPDDNIIFTGANYCRYPVKDDGTGNTLSKRPWCFTTDPTVTWEECPVPMCKELCSIKSDGSDYAGYVSLTRNNRQCLTWPNAATVDVNDRRGFIFSPDFSDWQTNIPSQHNYCRNPASSQSSPWCYIDKKGSSELCNIPVCPTSSDLSITVNLTVANLQLTLQSVAFSYGLVFVNGSQKWQSFTKEDFTSATICSEPTTFLFATVYNENRKRYMRLSVNCSDIWNIRSTSQAVNSFTISTKRDDKSWDYSTTDSTENYNYLKGDTTAYNNFIETDLFTGTNPCKSLVYNATGQFSSECHNLTSIFTVTENELMSSNRTSPTETSTSSVDIYTETTTPLYTRQTSETPSISTPKLSYTRNEIGDLSTLFTTKRSLETTLNRLTKHISWTNFTNSKQFQLKYLNISCFSLTNASSCYCPCSCSVKQMLVRSDVIFTKNYQRAIREQLKVDSCKMSQHVRKKNSAHDNRQTSKVVGIIAVITILTILIGIAILDLRQNFTSFTGAMKWIGIRQ